MLLQQGICALMLLPSAQTVFDSGKRALIEKMEPAFERAHKERNENALEELAGRRREILSQLPQVGVSSRGDLIALEDGGKDRMKIRRLSPREGLAETVGEMAKPPWFHHLDSISADGSYFMIRSQDEAFLKVVSALSGRTFMESYGPPDNTSVMRARFSPDGFHMSIGFDGHMRIYHFDGGESVPGQTFDLPVAENIQYLPRRDAFLVLSPEHTPRLFKIGIGNKLTAEYPVNGNPTKDFRLGIVSSTERLLVTVRGASDALNIIDVYTLDTPMRRLRSIRSSNPVANIAISPDETLLAVTSSGDRDLRVYDLNSPAVRAKAVFAAKLGDGEILGFEDNHSILAGSRSYGQIFRFMLENSPVAVNLRPSK